MILILLLGMIMLPGLATAAEVNLDVCLTEPRFCAETTDAWADSSCNHVFYSYHGRMSFEVLRNAGPVTISILTRRRNVFRLFPLYVSIVQNVMESDSCSSVVPHGSSTVLVAQSSGQCEGVWESIGPIDLTRHGIPLGSLYRVQALFLVTPPYGFEWRSVGLACVRVTSTSPVRELTWGLVKGLYK